MNPSSTVPSAEGVHQLDNSGSTSFTTSDDRRESGEYLIRLTSSSSSSTIVPNASRQGKNIARLRRTNHTPGRRLPLRKRKSYTAYDEDEAKDSDTDNGEGRVAPAGNEPSLIPEKPAAAKKPRRDSVSLPFVDPNHVRDVSDTRSKSAPTLPAIVPDMPPPAAVNVASARCVVEPNGVRPEVSLLTKVHAMPPPATNLTRSRPKVEKDHDTNTSHSRTDSVPRAESVSANAVHSTNMLPPYYYPTPYYGRYQPHSHTQSGSPWTYSWAPYASYSPPTPSDYYNPNEPNTSGVGGADDDDDSMDDDDDSVGSASTASAVNLVSVTQNGGLILNDKHGRPMVLIDSDSVDVSTLFRSHKVQVTNLTAADGNNIASLTLKSLATAPPAPSQHRKFLRWTEDEDDLLREAVSKSGPAPYNWKSISRKYFRGIRTSVQCKNRWLKVLHPSLKKSPFTDKEDAIIRQRKEADGDKPFAEIAKLLPGRSRDQVRERWLNELDPTLKKNEPWTDEEVEKLFKLQATMGNKWVAIAKLLPGRSENAVKNRWYNAKTSQRRLMKKLAKEAEARERLNRLAQARGEA